MTVAHLPDLDNCVTVYLDAWNEFGSDAFSVSDAVDELHQRDAADNGPDDSSLQRQLDLLAAYGLLEKVPESRYRVQCRPEETQLEWWERLESQVETLHDAVHETHRTESIENEHALLTYRGHKYVGFFVDDQTEFSDVVNDLRDVEELHNGIALRSPATIADSVQDLADRLCDANKEDVQAFEKVNSEVKGADNDDLEFRLYVTPRDA